MSWQVEQLETEEVHVSPLGDQIGHELTEECACGPRVEPVERNDGSTGWGIVHHSLDNREATE